MPANKMIKPPQSWKDPQTHFKDALNSDWYRIIGRLQADFIKATVGFYNTKNYDFALLPITTGAVSSPMGLGSDSTPVKVSIANIDTYLADSMQFFLEYACRLNKNGCYYIAPSFRGEKADDRHLSQFFHSEAEIIGNLNEVIKLVESYIRYLCQFYLDNSSINIIEVAGGVDHIKNYLQLQEVSRCTFNEAVEILKNDAKYIQQKDQYRTITNSGEQKLIEHFGGFVWLTHYDCLAVPFYQKSDKDFKKAACADLLMGIGETVGAGERHFNGDDVIKALQYHKVPQADYQWYMDMKNAVLLQTSGFGMGIERFMLWLLKHNDIRDMQIIPRFNGEQTIL